VRRDRCIVANAGVLGSRLQADQWITDPRALARSGRVCGPLLRRSLSPSLHRVSHLPLPPLPRLLHGHHSFFLRAPGRRGRRGGMDAFAGSTTAAAALVVVVIPVLVSESPFSGGGVSFSFWGFGVSFSFSFCLCGADAPAAGRAGGGGGNGISTLYQR
jgi:hypothetical protein